MTSAPALVIFDCDGVLVDSEPISNGVLAQFHDGFTTKFAQILKPNPKNPPSDSKLADGDQS